MEAWLTTIAKREAYRLHERHRPMDSLDTDPVSEHEALTTADHSETTIDRLTAHNLLAQAEPLDQVLLLHRFLLDHTSAEIARAVDMPHSTVRVRLHRSLRNLRRIELQHEQDDPT